MLGYGLRLDGELGSVGLGPLKSTMHNDRGLLPFCLGLWRRPSPHPLAPQVFHAHHCLSHSGTAEACHLLPGPGETLCLDSVTLCSAPA